MIKLILILINLLFSPSYLWSLSSPEIVTDTMTVRGSLNIDEIIGQLEKNDTQIKDIRFNLIQTINLGLTGEKIKLTAKVVSKKPDRLRIEYTSPRKQTVVANGKNIYLRTAGSDDVISTDWREWNRLGFFPKDFIGFTSRSRWTKSNYQPKLIAYENGYYQIQLFPKKNKDIKVTVWVSDTSWIPEKVVVLGEAFSAETKIDSIELNTNPNDNLFQLTTPKQ